MEALRLDELEVEDQEIILIEISTLVFEGTLSRIVERMDDDMRIHFAAFFEGNPSEDEMDQYLKERVPFADAMVEETVADMTRDILMAHV